MLETNKLHLRLTVDVIYDLDPEETGIQANKEDLKGYLSFLPLSYYLDGLLSAETSAVVEEEPKITVEEI